MSGHSKWATTKHKKAANDAKRSKLWAKLIKDIEVAARTGGGDPAGNPTLDDMIKKAKKASVPNDNIERARKRGSGEEAGGSDWESVMYVTVAKGELTEDDVLMAVLDAGAEEVNDLGEEFEVTCQPTDLAAVREALVEAGIEVEGSEQDFRADVEVELDASAAEKNLKLIDALEDSDDVQNVYSNMSIPDEIAAELDL